MDPFSEFIFSFPPIVSIGIVAFVITLFTSLVYRFVTDQKTMKVLKGELKDLQNMMKSHRDNPDKLMNIQQKAMEKNMEYMRHSMKPMLFTMLPLILIFGWLNTHIAYYPVMPDTTFDVWAEFESGSGGNVELNVLPDTPGFEIKGDPVKEITDQEVRWELQGPAGEYILQYTLNDKITVEQELLITDERVYKTPKKPVKKEDFKSLNIGNEKVKPFDFLGLDWGWIWAYIILSILFSTIIRKLLKIS